MGRKKSHVLNTLRRYSTSTAARFWSRESSYEYIAIIILHKIRECACIRKMPVTLRQMPVVKANRYDIIRTNGRIDKTPSEAAKTGKSTAKRISSTVR